MHVAGILPEDAPDPRIAAEEQLRLLPIAVMGLVPQPSLEDTGWVGLNSAHGRDGYTELTAVLSYTLWRHPADRSDPRNLAELDEDTRRAIREVPPWPRPPWLIEQVERMRYPQLEEAVRTTWDRDPSSAPSLATRLIDHVEHVLVNRFRRELGLSDVGSDWPWGQIPESAVSTAVTTVDGVELPAVELDTDPLVYGAGVTLPSGGLATAVISRAELEHVRIGFATRPAV